MSNFKLKLDEIAKVKADMQARYPDDDELLSDMIEGQTDLHELLSWVFSKIEDAKGDVAKLDQQIADRSARKKSRKATQDRMRALAQTLMEAGGQTSVKLPEVTFSISKKKAKRFVSDESLLPDEYIRVTRSPVMKLINEADEMPAGVSLDNGGTSLIIRSK